MWAEDKAIWKCPDFFMVGLEGQGLFPGKDGQTIPADPGDALISGIGEPRGVRAATDMRVPVAIAPLL